MDNNTTQYAAESDLDTPGTAAEVSAHHVGGLLCRAQGSESRQRDAARALWECLRDEPTARWARDAAGAIAELPPAPRVMAEVRKLVKEATKSTPLTEHCMTILVATGYATYVTAAMARAAVRLVHTSDNVWEIGRMLDEAGLVAGIHDQVWHELQQELSESGDADIRELATTVQRCRERVDLKWAARMLKDASSSVRYEVVQALLWRHEPGVEELLASHAEVETDELVAGSLRKGLHDMQRY